MKILRRDFITLLYGAAAAWPLAAHSQRRAMPVIGFLHGSRARAFAPYVAAFWQPLSEAGFVEGQNVAIEYRWAEGRFDLLPQLATDLVQRQVSVIATPADTSASQAAKAATATIPIVFGVSEDPVRLGLVASLNRPGGNATGINFFTTEVIGKRLSLLHELVPHAARIAVLINPAKTANAENTAREVEVAARALALQVKIFSAGSESEIDAAFTALMRERCDALFVGPDAFYNTRRVQLATLAARYAIPAVYSVREYVEAGGLMSYGTTIMDVFHQVGIYTGRILKGEQPAELPVVQATKFELVLNASTAKALGLTIPPTLLAVADEVIE
jgi:putative tryptophan/tyrosine transport system substrate-binding protein